MDDTDDGYSVGEHLVDHAIAREQQFPYDRIAEFRDHTPALREFARERAAVTRAEAKCRAASGESSHRDPDPASRRYRTLVTLASDQVFESAAVPGFAFRVASLFG